MHITIDEAIAILDSWKTAETLLDVHVSGAGQGRKLHVAVIGISGTVVSLAGNEGETKLDLAGATLNETGELLQILITALILYASTGTEILGHSMLRAL